MLKSKTINGDVLKSIIGGIFFCCMIGMGLGASSAQAATYTAKVSKCANAAGVWVTCDNSSPLMTGTLKCSDSTVPSDWYQDRGRRCGEVAGITYWNSDLAKTSATKLPLDCGNTTPPAAWYAGKGRCGDTDGLNWWNNDLKT